MVDVVEPVLFPDYPNVKRCTKCGEVRLITEFRRCAKGSEKRRSVCRLCNNAYRVAHEKTHKRKRCREYGKRKRWLKHQYGLTHEQYETMVHEQQRCCLICGKEPTKLLVVDHNHTTGQIRGLLCTRCNTLVGYIERSSPETLTNIFKLYY